MKHQLTLICTLLCVAIAGAVLAWRERELSERSEQVDSAFAANRRAMQAISEAQARATKPGAVATSSTTARPRPSDYEISRRVQNRLVYMAEYAPLRRREFQRDAMEQYAEWFAQLRVPPERLAVLKNAIVDKLTLMRDAYDAVRAAGYRTGTREFEEAVHKYRREADAQLARVLSADELASLKAFDRVKWFVTGNLPEIRDAFVDRNAPALSAEQVVALSSTWTKLQAWRPAGYKPGAVFRATNEKALELVAPLLSSEQNAALADYVRHSNAKLRRVGELANPDDPDGRLISVGVKRQ